MAAGEWKPLTQASQERLKKWVLLACAGLLVGTGGLIWYAFTVAD